MAERGSPEHLSGPCNGRPGRVPYRRPFVNVVARCRDTLAFIAAGNTTALVAANLGATLVGVVTGVVTARHLGPTARGDLAVVLFWPALLTSLLDAAIMEAVAIRGARRESEWRAELVPAFALALACAAAAVTIGTVAMPWLLTDAQGHLLPLARRALLFVPLSLVSSVPLGALLGQQRFRAVAAIRIANVAAYLLPLLGAIAMGYGTVSVITALTVLARGVPLLVAAPLMLGGGASGVSRRDISSLARDAAHLQGARALTVLSTSQDRLLANWSLTQNAIGLWQIIATVSVVMPIAAQGVSQHLLARIGAAGSVAGELVWTAYVRAMAATCVCAVVAVPLLPFVIPFLYGGDFAPAAAPAMIVAIGSIFWGGALALQAGARGVLRARPCVEAEGVGIAAMTLAGVIGVHFLGLTGLALAFALGRMVVLGWMAVRCSSLFGLPLRQMWPCSARFRATVSEQVMLVLRAAKPPTSARSKIAM